MKVDTLTRWPRLFSNGSVGRRGSGQELNTGQRDAVRHLQQTWLGMALHLVDSAETSTPLVLGITSAIGGEGKTTNCLGLGSALAKEIDGKVILVESDIASPGLATQLDLAPTPGLVQYLDEERPLQEIVRPTNLANLDVIVAGREQGGDTERDIWNRPVLSKVRRTLPDILAYLKGEYSYILLDLAPVLTNPYTKEMANATDSVFFSVRVGVTRTEHLARAVQDIGVEKLSGVMLVGAKSPLPRWVVDLLSGSE